MSFRINPITDKPQEDATLLGHDKIVNNLKTFLEQENMITPLSIAIHGDWGSGKTSIMKTLSKKLDTSKFAIVFFEAWKYEYSNPSLGLISELVEQFSSSRDIIRSVLTAALAILSNQYLGLDVDKVVDMLRQSKETTEPLANRIQKIIKQAIGNKMLIIIIDDLDRCDVENALQLLSIIKLFLDIENCVCIAAVDFNRLKQAWKTKYQPQGNNHDVGSEYLDKIFQIRIGIPTPPMEEIKKYLKTLVLEMPDTVAELFSNALPKNPRAIKRIINLVAYRQHLLSSPYKEFSAIFWTLLEEITGNTNLIYTSDKFKENRLSWGNLILRDGNNWETIQDKMNKMGQPPPAVTRNVDDFRKFMSGSHNITREFKITSDIIDGDFDILYHATNEALK